MEHLILFYYIIILYGTRDNYVRGRMYQRRRLETHPI